MRARARVPSVLVPAVPAASAGRHAQAGDSGEDAEFGFSQPFPVGPAVEGEFDFSLLFLVDIGRAAVIAEYLRESGYPRCTAKRGDRGTGETRAGAEQRRALRGRSAEEGRVAAMSLAALRRRLRRIAEHLEPVRRLRPARIEQDARMIRQPLNPEDGDVWIIGGQRQEPAAQARPKDG